MKTKQFVHVLSLLSGLLLLAVPVMVPSALAQEQTAATDSQAEDAAPPLLSAEDMDILVARIALYPDDLVALITAAALYPDEIVAAERFLEQSARNPSLKPDPKWDGSVISLLNYPEIVKMMVSDPDWTEELGTAVTYQEQDVLTAIQRLRDKAMDEGVLKSDSKTKVSREDDNIVIAPVSDEYLYVPRYEPQMLYEPGYAPVPLGYYPEPYPYYYDPTATFFAAAVTGVVWGVAIDWHRHGLWGGRWGHNYNFSINCRHCYRGRNINGPLRWRDIDWRKVDRRKISFDHRKFRDYHRRHFARSLEGDKRNNLHRRAVETRKRHRMKTLQQQRKSGIGQQGKKTKLRKKTRQHQLQMRKKNKLQKQKLKSRKQHKKKYKLKRNKKKRQKINKPRRQKQRMKLNRQRLKSKQFRLQRKNNNRQQIRKLRQNKPTLNRNRGGQNQQKRRRKKNVQ